MNKIDPILKRLMNWSRQSDASQLSNEAPFGFSARVVARWQSLKAPDLFLERLVAVAAWVSVVVIVFGGAFLWQQRHGVEANYPLPTAYQLAGARLLR